MNKLLFILILFPLHLFAEEKNLYAENEALFQTAKQPEISALKSGWYTGRCYTRREPLLEKAGAFVLIPVTSQNGSAGIKQIIPASSIRDESDYFDEIDSEEFENYNQELYEKSNQPGFFLNSSFTSDLYYGILIGSLHTRQIGSDLLVSLTNWEETPQANQNAHFYCRYTKKVRDL